MSTAAPGITIEQQIRWGDLDAMRHVNNTVFFQYCESARIAYVEVLGVETFRKTPDEDIGLVAASLNFRRQLRYPGTVTVRANVTKIGNRSFTLSYAIHDKGDGVVVADGDSICVWMDYAAGRAILLPEPLIERIAEIEQNPSLRT